MDSHLSVDDMSSAESWKLFLTRVSDLLDVTLVQLSNQVQDWLASDSDSEHTVTKTKSIKKNMAAYYNKVPLVTSS